MVKQRESLGQLDGNVSLNSIIKEDIDTIQKCEHIQNQIPVPNVTSVI